VSSLVDANPEILVDNEVERREAFADSLHSQVEFGPVETMKEARNFQMLS
jgi:hypothetical protein